MKSEAKIKAALGFAKPPKFPMTFRQFLRRMFGGRLHSVRLGFFRRFLVEEYFASYADPQEVAVRQIGLFNKNGIQSYPYFYFEKDIAKWRLANHFRQRKKANSSRWIKEKRKKILAVLQHRINALSQTGKYSLASQKRKKSAGSHFRK
jgi:hypothetical protein